MRKMILALFVYSTMFIPVGMHAVDPATVDAVCTDPANFFDPAVHGTYDGTTHVRFCTPWEAVDPDTQEPIAIDDAVYQLTACNLEAAGTGSTLVTTPFPGFGKAMAMTTPAQFIQEYPVDLVCYLGRVDGTPIDPGTGTETLASEAATTPMRFRLAVLPAGSLLQP